MILILQMKLIKRTKKLGLRLNIELGRIVLSSFHKQRTIIEQLKQFNAQIGWGQNSFHPSCYPDSVEKMYTKRRDKNRLVLFFFLYAPAKQSTSLTFNDLNLCGFFESYISPNTIFLNHKNYHLSTQAFEEKFKKIKL